MLGQLARFALVGVVNTGIYFGTYLLLKQILLYLVAHVIAFAFSVIVSFFLNCYFTYRVPPTWRKFVRFPLSTIANFIVTTAGLYVLVEWAGVSRTYAPLLAASAAIPVTFVVARIILLEPRMRNASDPTRA